MTNETLRTLEGCAVTGALYGGGGLGLYTIFEKDGSLVPATIFTSLALLATYSLGRKLKNYPGGPKGFIEDLRLDLYNAPRNLV